MFGIGGYKEFEKRKVGIQVSQYGMVRKDGEEPMENNDKNKKG